MTLPHLPPVERRCTFPGCRAWTVAAVRQGWRSDRCIAHDEPEERVPAPLRGLPRLLADDSPPSPPSVELPQEVVPGIRLVRSPCDGPRLVAGVGPQVVMGGRCEGRGRDWREALAAMRRAEAACP